MMEESTPKASFKPACRQSLQPHYARTLDLWAETFEKNQSAAIAIQSKEVYEQYTMKYRKGCTKLFHAG